MVFARSGGFAVEGSGRASWKEALRNEGRNQANEGRNKANEGRNKANEGRNKAGDIHRHAAGFNLHLLQRLQGQGLHTLAMDGNLPFPGSLPGSSMN